ncbi:hypothetical protein G6F37_005353 [Rhizopus arrhizus]|nr:hypothetical protein G6F38_004574 [Rhizopus arrhizus]KAG1158936.1 hypothetical protein G6F37_005353 [Rhizopus arrhizus]
MKHFGKTNVIANQLERWVNADGYWGPTRRSQRGERPYRQRGRYVWKLKDEHCDLIDRESYKRLKKHLRTNPMITIGYVRKPPTKEGHDSRLGLLQKMINRLKRGTCCSKVYVSPKSAAATPLKQRDQVENGIDLTRLDYCDGDTRTLLDKLKCDFREIRIACLGYAGLTTNTMNLLHFLKKYKQIQEIVVLHPRNVKILSRHQLITDDTIIQRFNCRIGPEKRS